MAQLNDATVTDLRDALARESPNLEITVELTPTLIKRLNRIEETQVTLMVLHVISILFGVVLIFLVLR